VDRVDPPASLYAPPASGRTGDVGKPPRRWVAALLTLLATGLGHVYCGRIARGLAWALSLPLAWLAFELLLERAPVHGATMGAMAGLFVASLFAAMRDAARTAVLPTARRSAVVIVVAAGVLLFGFARGVTFAMRQWVMEAFSIPSASMAPSLMVGDHLFVDKTRSVLRGDIVVFPSMDHPEQVFMKRVLGLSGDRVAFESGLPILNGAPIDSCLVGQTTLGGADGPLVGDVFVEWLDAGPYLAFYDHDGRSRAPAHQGPWTVKDGEMFVVGDNRYNAYDSRQWFGGKGGGLPVASARGVAFVVWLAAGSGGIDWGRTGVRLDTPELPASMRNLEPKLARCLTEPHGQPR